MNNQLITDKRKSLDLTLLVAILILLGLGITAVLSTSLFQGKKLTGDPYFFLKKQLFFLGLGSIFFTSFIYFPIKYWKKFSFLGYILSLALLVAVFVPGLGKTVNGATSWIDFGFFSFQPAEMVKIFLIFVLSQALLEIHNEANGNFFVFFKPVLLVAVPVLLILMQTDLGTAFHIILFAGILILIGGFPLSNLLLILFFSMPFLYFFLYKSERNWRRISAFLDPFADPSSKGYQLIQSLSSFYFGGIWGRGIGKGIQKNYRLPEPHTDFIFSAMAEELGIIWSIGIVILFLIILWRGYKIVLDLDNTYLQYVGAGLLLMILSQALINIGVVSGSLPITGIPLPFISYGGTHLIITLMASGILLNLSRYGVKRNNHSAV